MTHLFRLVLQHADMFIREVNLKDNFIVYQMLDQEGNPMEPLKKEPLLLHKKDVMFDKNRTLPLELVKRIHEILNS